MDNSRSQIRISIPFLPPGILLQGFGVWLEKKPRTTKSEWMETVMHYSCGLAVKMDNGCGCIPFHASQPGGGQKVAYPNHVSTRPAKVAATETDRVSLAVAGGFW